MSQNYTIPELSTRQKERLIVLLVESLIDGKWTTGRSIFNGGNPKRAMKSHLSILHEKHMVNRDTVGQKVYHAMIYLYYWKQGEEPPQRLLSFLQLSFKEAITGHILRYGDEVDFNQLIELATKEGD